MYYSQQQLSETVMPWKIMLGLMILAFLWQGLTRDIHAKPSPVVAPAVATIPIAVDPVVKSYSQPKPKFLSIVDTNEKIMHNRTDIFCMAKNIYHEAGHESKLGKYAVAQVTVNRMKDPRFEKGICEVVLEPYQFSWANNHRMRWTTPAGPRWEESKRIARDVLENGKRIHGLEDALFYHADYVRPYWARVKKRMVQIGAHIFYRPYA